MRYILANKHRPILEQYAWSNVLLGLDFDGTLAPIVEAPAEAVMRPRTRALLGKVADRYPCAVISGRARSDVRARVSGIRLVEVVGNHGIEPSREAARCVATVAKWEEQLARRLASLPGVQLENKGPSLAIHYRRSRERRAARRAIDRAVTALGARARIVTGKLVVNVVPRGAPNKGSALRRLRDRARTDTAIYVGDDVTDEDVFMLDEPGRLLSIRVGRDDSSAAPFYLRAQREIDELLALLARFRS